MVWFGDIDIPWITDKDTSIDREVIEKNFAERPPDVFELTPDLESGTYTAVLNENVHSRSETFGEQTDAVQSMPSRHVTEFPVDINGEVGHVMVDTSTVAIFPSLEIREAEMDLRFMEKKDYKPGFVLEADHYNSNFTPTPKESLVAIPNKASNIQDSADNTLSPQFTLSAEDGDLDLYLYDDNREAYDFERPSDYTSGERISPVRLYKSIGGERVYSDSDSLENYGYSLENGLVRFEHNQSQNNVYIYDGSWTQIGNLNISGDDGYAPTNRNYQVEVDLINEYTSSLLRGFTVGRFDIAGTTSFTFSTNDTLSTGSTANWYRTVTNGNGDEIILIRTSSDGSFSDDSSTLEVTGLTSSKHYTLYFGFVPSSPTTSDYARYVYNIGSWKRTLIQK